MACPSPPLHLTGPASVTAATAQSASSPPLFKTRVLRCMPTCAFFFFEPGESVSVEEAATTVPRQACKTSHGCVKAASLLAPRLSVIPLPHVVLALVHFRLGSLRAIVLGAARRTEAMLVKPLRLRLGNAASGAVGASIGRRRLHACSARHSEWRGPAAAHTKPKAAGVGAGGLDGDPIASHQHLDWGLAGRAGTGTGRRAHLRCARRSQWKDPAVRAT